MGSYFSLKMQNVHYAKLDFYEIERSLSFRTWFHPRMVMPLIKNGLKYEGINHRVRCVGCQKSTDDFVFDHVLNNTHFSGCAFQNGGQDRRNISVSQEAETVPLHYTMPRLIVPGLNDNDESIIRMRHVSGGFNGCIDACLSMCPCDTCVINFHEDNVRVVNNTSPPLNLNQTIKSRQLKLLYIQPGKDENPQLSSFQSRISSFPHDVSRFIRRSVALAGFSNVDVNQDRGRTYVVKCFSCGLSLCLSESNISCGYLPWVLHAEFFPTCRYLRMMAGDDFIHRRLWIKRTNLNNQIVLYRQLNVDDIGARLLRCW